MVHLYYFLDATASATSSLLLYNNNDYFFFFLLHALNMAEEFAEEPPSINPYEVLGIDEKATADAVKSAYRKKALKHHPGKSALWRHFYNAPSYLNALSDRFSVIRTCIHADYFQR